ncbi:hypothetical protein [Thioalkalivibrio sp.]|uniref:hypothetical protein n=1 Tax=Thioalkalivibrio sp. TaxID=2093813 RepID=UPI0039759527
MAADLNISTPSLTANIKARRELSTRCSAWIKKNSYQSWAKRFEVDVKAIAAVGNNRKHRILTDQQFVTLQRFFVRMRRVKEMRRLNSTRAIAHELNISCAAVSIAAKGAKSRKVVLRSKRERLKFAAFAFLTAPAINPNMDRLTHY